jgi:polysaccharide biosynthesis transport protein
MESASPEGLSTYLRALRRRRGLMLLVALPVLLGALVVAFALPDRYSSAGLVGIEQQRLEGVRSSTRSASDDFIQEYVRSIASELLTEASLKDAASRLELYPALKGNAAAAASRMARDTRIEMARSTILDPMSGREREIINGFRVIYTNPDPRLAYIGAEWLTREFIAADRSKRAGRESETAVFFAGEADRVSRQMADLEEKLADHRRRNFGRLPELNAVNLNSLDRMERDLENVQLQIGMLRKDRVFIQQRLAESTSTFSNSDQLARAEEELRRKSAQYDASHPDIVSLRRQIETLRLSGSTTASGGSGASLQDQLNALQASLTETRQRYSESHPDVRRIQRQIATLEERIAAGETTTPGAVRTAASEQLQVQLRSTDTQISALESRAGELRGKLGIVENRMAAAPEVEREAQSLQRDISSARTKYEQLLASRMDAEITRAAIEAGKADEFRVMQPPFRPISPSEPKRAAIGIVGVILAIILALTFAGVAEMLDPTVRGSRDLQKLLSITPMAVVPVIRTPESLARERRRIQLAAGIVIASGVLLFVGLKMWVK